MSHFGGCSSHKVMVPKAPQHYVPESCLGALSASGRCYSLTARYCTRCISTENVKIVFRRMARLSTSPSSRPRRSRYGRSSRPSRLNQWVYAPRILFTTRLSSSALLVCPHWIRLQLFIMSFHHFIFHLSLIHHQAPLQLDRRAACISLRVRSR